MTKPKVPTTKAKAFGQAPKAGHAKPLAPGLQHQAGSRRSQPLPEPSSNQTTRALRIPFQNHSHVYQAPEAANGDEDAMGQQQD